PARVPRIAITRRRRVSCRRGGRSGCGRRPVAGRGARRGRSREAVPSRNGPPGFITRGPTRPAGGTGNPARTGQARPRTATPRRGSRGESDGTACPRLLRSGGGRGPGRVAENAPRGASAGAVPALLRAAFAFLCRGVVTGGRSRPRRLEAAAAALL